MDRILRNKIKIIFSAFFIITISFNTVLWAQPLRVIKKYKTYCEQVQNDSFQKMVELRSLIPELKYDLRYAGSDNFTQRKFYKSDKYTFLRLAPAAALKNINEELKRIGLGLKIYDAYRPYHVTQKMWDLIRDERYVANPLKGSGHNRGISVDLTLVNLDTGKELDMGTGFDNFTDTAHHEFKALSPEVLNNRVLLRKTMEKHGFRVLETEWWHYSWPNDRKYDVLNLDFKKLRENR